MTQPKPTPLNMYEGEEVEPYLCGAYNFPLDQLRLVLTQNYADREVLTFNTKTKRHGPEEIYDALFKEFGPTFRLWWCP